MQANNLVTPTAKSKKLLLTLALIILISASLLTGFFLQKNIENNQKITTEYEQKISQEISNIEKIKTEKETVQTELNYYKNEHNWYKCSDEVVKYTSLAIHDLNFEIDTSNANFVKLDCEIDFAKSQNSNTNYAEYVLNCSPNSACRYFETNYNECQSDFSKKLSDLKLVSPYTIKVTKTYEEDLSQKIFLTKNITEDEFFAHNFTFYSDKPTENQGGAYTENLAHTKVDLTLSTYEEVEEKEITEFAKEVINNVNFIYDKKNMDQCNFEDGEEMI